MDPLRPAGATTPLPLPPHALFASRHRLTDDPLDVHFIPTFLDCLYSTFVPSSGPRLSIELALQLAHLPIRSDVSARAYLPLILRLDAPVHPSTCPVSLPPSPHLSLCSPLSPPFALLATCCLFCAAYSLLPSPRSPHCPPDPRSLRQPIRAPTARRQPLRAIHLLQPLFPSERLRLLPRVG